MLGGGALRRESSSEDKVTNSGLGVEAKAFSEDETSEEEAKKKGTEAMGKKKLARSRRKLVQLILARLPELPKGQQHRGLEVRAAQELATLMAVPGMTSADFENLASTMNKS